MNNKIGQYKIFILIFIIFCIVYAIFSIVSISYSDYLSNGAYESFLEGKAPYYPLREQLDWDSYVIYREIDNLEDEKNIILIGSSTTMGGILPDKLKIEDNYSVKNFAVSGANTKEYRVMMNYINNYSGHPPDDLDIVVFHIWYGAFADEDFMKYKAIGMIELSGDLHVDDSLNIEGYKNPVNTQVYLSNSKIRRALGFYSFGQDLYFKFEWLAGTLASTISGEEEVEPDMEAQIEGYKEFWKYYVGNITYPGAETEEFMKLLEETNNRTNVVVLDLYMPSWHRSSDEYKEYVEWKDDELMPFLAENNIIYYDSTILVPDEHYFDSSHLLIDGREMYTDFFNEKMNAYISQLPAVK